MERDGMIRKAEPLPEPESVTDPFEFLSRLEDMRADSDFEWASDSIEGIYTTVTASGRVTEGQLRAIDNIEDGARRHSRGRW